MIEQIEARMTALGMTGADLARAMGVTPQRVSDIRRGRYKPGLATVEAIAKALGCRLVMEVCDEQARVAATTNKEVGDE
ncbi:MAG: helix-turn-helix domain-containing protein [Planctomycetota bacterium]|jgi:transcriptional regulator with XRE-family HTH domain